MNPVLTTPSVSAPSLPDLNTITGAQDDMRVAYMNGATGVLASGLVWAVAAGVAMQVSPARAVWALFIGGMFIHPLAMLLSRVLGRSGRHTPGNPLSALAMATTFWMIMMLPLTYGLSLLRIEFFFPAMLLVIGGRYLCFHTLYGDRTYWVMGAVLALAGFALVKFNASPVLGAAAGAAIEIGFALFLMVGAKRAGSTLAGVA